MIKKLKYLSHEVDCECKDCLRIEKINELVGAVNELLNDWKVDRDGLCTYSHKPIEDCTCNQCNPLDRECFGEKKIHGGQG